MKRDVSPDYIRGQVDMFKTLQKLYWLTDTNCNLGDILLTDARTANEMWEKWMLFGKHRLAEKLVGHPRYKKGNLEKAEEDYNRAQYDPEFREEIEKEYDKNKKLVKAIIEKEEDE